MKEYSAPVPHQPNVRVRESAWGPWTKTDDTCQRITTPSGSSDDDDDGSGYTRTSSSDDDDTTTTQYTDGRMRNTCNSNCGSDISTVSADSSNNGQGNNQNRKDDEDGR